MDINKFITSNTEEKCIYAGKKYMLIMCHYKKEAYINKSDNMKPLSVKEFYRKTLHL